MLAQAVQDHRAIGRRREEMPLPSEMSSPASSIGRRRRQPGDRWHRLACAFFNRVIE